MKKKITPRQMSRRKFLKLGGQGALLAALGGGAALYGMTRRPLQAAPGWPGVAPEPVVLPPRRPESQATVNVRLAATDGFISLPGRRIFPDPANVTDPTDLPDDHNGVFVFGFVNVPLSVTPGGITDQIGEAILEFKGRVQGPAPIIEVSELSDVNITLTNLGFELRPDLDDSHTIHWHGFRNPNAIFDGVPEVSISVPPGRDFTYFYRPRTPGSFPYHCHFEDTEHVQLGMDGVVFVTPTLGRNFVFNDLSTRFDRQYALLLNEIDTSPHDQLVNVQEFVWSDYDPNYWVINSRSYPDTLLRDHEIVGTDLERRQPISSLIQVLPGFDVLLRLVNLGYQQQAMQLPGIRMRVVGQDATPLGPLAYETTTVYIGPGESRDVIFTAPGFFDGDLPVETDDVGRYNLYWLKNHNFQRLTNGAGDRVGDPGSLGAPAGVPADIFGNPSPLGGQITQVRIYDTADPNLSVENFNALVNQERANQTVPIV